MADARIARTKPRERLHSSACRMQSVSEASTRFCSRSRKARLCVHNSTGGRRAAADHAHPTSLEQLLMAGARPTTAAKQAWRQLVRPGDLVVDCTCGNGHDTAFLAQLVGPTGCVYAMDVQESALEATRARLAATCGDRLPEVHLLSSCHSRLQEFVGSNRARLVCFNLGYLPGGDKAITTRLSTTVAAVEAALEVCCEGGLISIVAYVGHEGGREEYAALRALLAELKPQYWVAVDTAMLNRPKAPGLLLAWRKTQEAEPSWALSEEQ